jgi:hypothetical protein
MQHKKQMDQLWQLFLQLKLLCLYLTACPLHITQTNRQFPHIHSIVRTCRAP